MSRQSNGLPSNAMIQYEKLAGRHSFTSSGRQGARGSLPVRPTSTLTWPSTAGVAQAAGSAAIHCRARASCRAGTAPARPAGRRSLRQRVFTSGQRSRPSRMPPPARRLHAQAPGVANPPERQEGDKQQHAGDAVEAVRKPKQPARGARQTLLRQHRQSRRDAATRHRLRRLGKHRLCRFHLAGHGQCAARDMVRRPTHRRFPVKPVSRAAVTTPLRSPSPADHPRAPVLAERAHRYAQTARHRTAAQVLQPQRFRLPNPRRIQHNSTTTPTSLSEPRLSLLPATPYRPGHRRKRNAERSRYILLTDAAQQMKTRRPQLRRTGLLRRMAVNRNQIGELHRPGRDRLHGQIAADQRGFRRRPCKRLGNIGSHPCSVGVSQLSPRSGATPNDPKNSEKRNHDSELRTAQKAWGSSCICGCPKLPMPHGAWPTPARHGSTGPPASGSKGREPS